MTIEMDKYGNKYFENDMGQLHRIDGPAIEYPNGSKYWYVNGKCHRIDGPAVELVDGSKNWYISNVKLTEEEFDYWVKNNGTDWNNELETLLKLSYL